LAKALKPLADRVVLKPLKESESKSAGGIFIPDTAKEKPQIGEVIAVGPGKTSDDGKRIAVPVKVGDSVIYSKYAGTEYKTGGDEYLIVRADDVLAIIG
jgi:chaperonin GroES